MASPTIPSSADNADNLQSKLSFIHRYYLLLKAHYFLFFAAFGIFIPIVNITLRSRGLSNTELSYLNIAIPFLILFTNPLMSYIADLSRRYKLTFNCIYIITAIACASLLVAPSVKSRNIQADMIRDENLNHILDFCASQELATKCASRTECGCTYKASCNFIDARNGEINNQMQPFSFNFSMKSKNIHKDVKDITEQRACGIEYQVPIDDDIKQNRNNPSFDRSLSRGSSSRLAACEITCSIAHFCHGPRNSGQTRLIVLYSGLFVIGNNFLTNSIPLGAAIGFNSLHRADLFGKQRFWGTIGFGIAAYTASLLYKYFQTDYVYFIMFCIASVACMIVTCFIRIQPDRKKRRSTVDEIIIQKNDDLNRGNKKNRSQFKMLEILPLLKKIDVIIFFSLTIVWGMSFAVLEPYLYLYIDEIAPCQSHIIIGRMSLVSAISEVIAFFSAGRLLKLFGTNLSSVIILLAFSVRFGGYYYIRQPYLLPCMEIMHFFNFGILLILLFQQADSFAPPGLSGTLQSLSLGLCFGLGKGIGLIISSFIYTTLEQRLLFLIFAIFNLICAIIYGIYFLISRKNSNKSIEYNTSNIIVESDTKSNEEPLLVSSIENKSDNQIDK
ncbi:unnamed protein product [Adineta steineri]|uniref:Major facilitator superfamily associated domain-containing protein n=1 Tax=Adineta steineri TaxID=433720 RepID=A0A819B8S4_9BILA|nr:unnamed protein product [Adineta steineri]CAF1492460.1 unnamed protein product [Adineta steineri]CAF3796894.1 unnamed protein product [Adineta steineri]CAF4200701.1 unnamed protein product [Adineta steineri]